MNPIIDKIRKTLAMAHGAGASDQERETALRMAHALLMKHNLTMADIDAKAADASRTVHEAQFFGRPWARIVCQSVARVFLCEYLYTSFSGEQKVKHMFVGTEANVVTASEMAAYLVASIQRESRRHESPRSFANGAADSLAKRARAMHEAARHEPSTGRDLVVVEDREMKANQEFMRARFPTLRSVRSRAQVRNEDSYRAGQTYGRQVSLNRQVK